MCCSRRQTHPLEELGGDLLQIGDDTCVEERLLLGRAHLLEFGGSHDLPGHRSILFPEQVSASRPRCAGCIRPDRRIDVGIIEHSTWAVLAPVEVVAGSGSSCLISSGRPADNDT